MKLLEQKTLFILAITVFFVFAQNTEASVVINEVQVKPVGGSFIELYNDGADQDLTDWSIKRKTKSGKEYPVVSETKFKGVSIKSNNFLLLSIDGNTISDFNPDIVWAKSNILANDNSIYLYNKNGDINNNVISTLGWGEVSDCDLCCTVNPPEGKSIQRISDSECIIATPTPGEINSSSGEEVEENNDGDETNDNSSSSSTISSTKKKEIILNPKITTKIITKKTVVAGIPFDINHETIGYKNEKKILGRFVWNFGDGMVREEEYSAPFPYVYEYPGDYALTLSFYDTHFSLVPEATDRVNIKVIPSGINIISVGPASDPYVEIENNSSYEMALYKWIIKGSTHLFTIPEGTIILPNKKIKLSPKITGFDASDLNSIIIYDDKGTVFAVYPKKKVYTPIRVSSSSYSSNKTISSNSFDSNINPETEEIGDSKNVIDLNSLGASAESSGSKISRSVYPWIGLTVIIILGIVGILSIQKRNKDIKDYMDDEVRPEDITIME